MPPTSQTLNRFDTPNWLSLVPVMSQRQDSEQEQMADLHRVAVRLGMYDAADILRRREEEFQRMRQTVAGGAQGRMAKSVTEPKPIRGFSVLARRVEVACNLTADQWGLYTSSMDCAPVAAMLNQTFTESVNRGWSRREVEIVMSALCSQNSDSGAGDSETAAVLNRLLDVVFPR